MMSGAECNVHVDGENMGVGRLVGVHGIGERDAERQFMGVLQTEKKWR